MTGRQESVFRESWTPPFVPKDVSPAYTRQIIVKGYQYRIEELEREIARLRANQRTGRIIHGDAL